MSDLTPRLDGSGNIDLMHVQAAAGALPGRTGEREDALIAVSRRVQRRLTIALLLAHGLGALDVFLLLWWVLPFPEGAPVGEVLTANVVAFALYTPLGAFVGWWTGTRIGRETRAAFRATGTLTPEQRRAILRSPLRCTAVDGGLWLGAIVLFFAINLPASAELAAHVAVTIGLGGLTVCTVAYLLTEKLMRPVTAIALAEGQPPQPIGPGVKGRLLIVWITATGVPLLGLVMLGCQILADGVDDPQRVAISVIALAVVAIATGLGALAIAARSLADPLTRLRRALGRVEAGDLSGEVPVDDGSEIGLLQAGFNRMASGLRERERLHDLFDRHVGSDVARAALDSEPVLGGETREVAVLFVDIVGSTALAEHQPPDQVVRLLNRFFGVVVDVAGDHGGWVNKFEGDAALCVFGAPAPQPDPAGCALSAGRDLAARLRREVPELDAGIGISAGPAVAGWMGAERRVEYTVIGDPVNEASRLCDLAKRREERILASERILARAAENEARRWRLGDSTHLRGRTAPTRLAAPA